MYWLLYCLALGKEEQQQPLASTRMHLHRSAQQLARQACLVRERHQRPLKQGLLQGLELEERRQVSVWELERQDEVCSQRWAEDSLQDVLRLIGQPKPKAWTPAWTVLEKDPLAILP